MPSITSLNKGIVALGMFPDMITTDYLNTETSRDARAGNPAMKAGERMIAIKDPNGLSYCVTTDLKIEDKSIKGAILLAMQALALQFFPVSEPTMSFTVDINDAKAQLKEFETRYGGRGRPFLRAEDATHFTCVPYYAPLGVPPVPTSTPEVAL